MPVPMQFTLRLLTEAREASQLMDNGGQGVAALSPDALGVSAGSLAGAPNCTPIGGTFSQPYMRKNGE
ncbi:unnamed protein product [Lampetra planeri]